MNNLLTRLKSYGKLKSLLYFTICFLLFLYVFSIPSFSNRRPLNIISYGSMGLLAGCVFLYLIIYKKIIFDKKIIVVLIFVVDALLCTVISAPVNFRRWISVLLMSITFIVVLYSCKCVENKRLILKILLFAFLSFGIYFAIIPEHRMKILKFSISMSDRLGDYFDNVNLIGSYFAIGFGLSLYLGLIHDNKKDYFFLICALPCAYLGLFTGSRAFIFLLTILSIAILYIKFGNKKLIFFLTLIGIIIIFVLLVSLIPAFKVQFEKTIYTLFGIGNPDPKNIDTSSVERVLWMRYGFSIGSKNALIGLGCNGFATFSGVGTYSHNNFSELLCNFGIPGFLIFNYIILYPFILHFASDKKESKLTIMFTFYFLVKSMFSVFYYYKDFYLIMSICCFMVDDVSFSDVRNKIATKFKKDNIKSISV